MPPRKVRGSGAAPDTSAPEKSNPGCSSWNRSSSKRAASGRGASPVSGACAAKAAGQGSPRSALVRETCSWPSSGGRGGRERSAGKTRIAACCFFRLAPTPHAPRARPPLAPLTQRPHRLAGLDAAREVELWGGEEEETGRGRASATGRLSATAMGGASHGRPGTRASTPRPVSAACDRTHSHQHTHVQVGRVVHQPQRQARRLNRHAKRARGGRWNLGHHDEHVFQGLAPLVSETAVDGVAVAGGGGEGVAHETPEN